MAVSHHCHNLILLSEILLFYVMVNRIIKYKLRPANIELSVEDCWLNGRFVPWQSMVNHLLLEHNLILFKMKWLYELQLYRHEFLNQSNSF